jgi:hypothetical protein
MRTILILALLVGLGSLPALAGEAGDIDPERSLVKDGVLGTINVLRELDIKTWTNRVTATTGSPGFSIDWGGGPVESTIDGGAASYLPKNPSDPWVVTYRLPDLRIVSSLVIQYSDRGSAAPETVRLEGSADGGKSWSALFPSLRPRETGRVLKCFKPAKVNALRLTQEGGTPRTQEVFVYADPEAPPLPRFGVPEGGAFSFLRELWYGDRIKLVRSPNNGVWTALPHVLPEKVLFMSGVASAHDGGFGDAREKGKRLYLRLDLDKPHPMNYGLIGTPDGGETGRPARCRLGLHPAEFYTANGHLDPSTLQGSSIKDLTGQGWILQKAWDNDPSACKVFRLEHPGKYNQILVVWDAFAAYENDRWSRLEMFGVETPSGGAGAREQP